MIWAKGVKKLKYYTIHETAEMLGVSPQTLRNWDKSGRLVPHHKSAKAKKIIRELREDDKDL